MPVLAMSPVKFKRVVLLLCCIALLSAMNVSSALPTVLVGPTGKYKKLSVYYFMWNFISETTISPDWTRIHKTMYLESTDSEYIEGFVNWLQVNELKSTSGLFCKGDRLPRASLVIDIELRDGQRVSYYSDGRYLYSGDFKLYREVSKSFRQQFSLGASETLFEQHDVNNDAPKCLEQ